LYAGGSSGSLFTCAIKIRLMAFRERVMLEIKKGDFCYISLSLK
jgi:hypothetical protein